MRFFNMSVCLLSIVMATPLVLSGCKDDRPTSGCGICDDGCSSDTCTVTCVGEEACADRTLQCPEGLDCSLNCEGLDSCDNVVFSCPPDHDCRMSCEGRDACGDTTFNCSSGDCTMACGVHVDSCEGGQINCGTGACILTCDGSVPPAVNGCDQAASCTGC